VPISFGIFTLDQNGGGYGIITDAQYRLYAPAAAASPGDVVTIWGTGLGPVNGDEATGPLPGDMTNVPVEVYVGLQPAELKYRGRSGCCAGLDQIAFVVPPDVIGCSVPVAVKIGDIVSNFVFLPIAPAPRVCSDPGWPSAGDVQHWLTKGSISIGNLDLERSINPTGPNKMTLQIDDNGGGEFLRYSSASVDSAYPFYSSVPGTCFVSAIHGNQTLTPAPFAPATLNAGASIQITGSNGGRQLMYQGPGSENPGTYSADLGDGPLPGATYPPFLDPGSYTITGTGGPDIGAFTVTVTMPTALNWTNSTITTVPRSQGQIITWTGADPAAVVSVSGYAYSDVASSFSCFARGRDGQPTIPPFVLLSMPPNSSVAGLSVGVQTGPVPFTATGMDYGTVTAQVSTANSAINFQ